MAEPEHVANNRDANSGREMSRDDPAPRCFRSLEELTRAYALRVAAKAASQQPAAEPVRRAGTLKTVFRSKGFGFITPDDGGADVFCHQTTIHADGFRSLGEGEAVEFNVKTDSQGRTQAENVTGPDGAFVVGSPPPRRDDYYDEY